MNGIEKITARIQEDSQKEIDAILAEARAKADEITARARADAQAAGDEVMAQGRRAAAEREDRMASTAQMECRKAVLAAKQEVIEEAFRQAHKRLLERLLDDVLLGRQHRLAALHLGGGRHAVLPLSGGLFALGRDLVAYGLGLRPGFGGDRVGLGAGFVQDGVDFLPAVLLNARGNLFNSVHVFGLPPFLACLVWTHA